MRARVAVAFLLLSGIASACRDSTGPRAADHIYVLNGIDGQAPPGDISIFGRTTFVESGVLTLHVGAHASWVAQVRSSGQASQDTTVTIQLIYHTAGDSIRIEYTSRCRDVCVPDEEGAFSDSALTLTYAESPHVGPVYHFRRVGSTP